MLSNKTDRFKPGVVGISSHLFGNGGIGTSNANETPHWYAEHRHDSSLLHILFEDDTNEDEPPLSTLPFPIKLILTLALITSLSVGTYFKCIFYKSVFVTNKVSLHNYLMPA